MNLCDFIAEDVEDCPICGNDELDFWDAPPSPNRPLATGQYLCQKCHGVCELLGLSPQKGKGRGLLQIVRSAKKHWNEWAKKLRKDKDAVESARSFLKNMVVP